MMNLKDIDQVNSLVKHRTELLELLTKTGGDKTWELVCERYHDSSEGHVDISSHTARAVIEKMIEDLDRELAHLGVQTSRPEVPVPIQA